MADQVDVWLGRAADEQSFEAFFDETYGEDDAPISAFAASQGETFYDHDFIDRVRSDSFSSLDESFYGLSYGPLIEEVRAKISEFDYNGVSRLGLDSFDDERSMPCPGITFSVGPLEFLWSDQPKQPQR